MVPHLSIFKSNQLLSLLSLQKHNSFYIQEKSKAKEFVKYINKKIESSKKTDLNIEANNKELIKGKYQIN